MIAYKYIVKIPKGQTLMVLIDKPAHVRAGYYLYVSEFYAKHVENIYKPFLSFIDKCEVGQLRFAHFDITDDNGVYVSKPLYHYTDDMHDKSMSSKIKCGKDK